jgi:hypothetical protein
MLAPTVSSITPWSSNLWQVVDTAVGSIVRVLLAYVCSRIILPFGHPAVQVLKDKLAQKQREAQEAASAAQRALAQADAPEDGRVLAAKAVQDLAGSCDVVLTTYAVLAKEVCGQRSIWVCV